MKNTSNMHLPENQRLSKDSKSFGDERYKGNRKHDFLARTEIVYSQFCRMYGATANMVLEALQDEGYKYSYQQVRQSLLYLEKHKYISYWGKDRCEATGHRAIWFDMPLRERDRKVFNPEIDLNHAG